MLIATFQGLRGGTGTSSIVAMLADALHRQGEHVLVVDACPTDTLRLFFGVPLADERGWAAALDHGKPWHEQAFRVDTGLDLLPFGRNGLANGHSPSPSNGERPGESAGDFWCRMLPLLQDACSWLLFDLPADTTEYQPLQALAQLDIRVAAVDAGCHLRMAQTPLPATAWRLASLYDPTRTLSSDILQEWRARGASRMIPVSMHRDEAVHEALAGKTTVQLMHPESMGARDANSLATWCRAHTGSSA